MQRISKRKKANSAHCRELAQSLSKLCQRLHDAKEASGDGFEGLFVLLLLARCIATMPDDYYVPARWFHASPVVHFNSAYDHNGRSCNECTSWEQLKEGLVLGSGPQISIFYPQHASFNAYDAVALYINRGELFEIYGYQLKESSSSKTRDVEDSFTKNFFIRGLSLKDSRESNNGWIFPGDDKLDEFYGESGKYWTPKWWKRLSEAKPHEDGSDEVT